MSQQDTSEVAEFAEYEDVLHTEIPAEPLSVDSDQIQEVLGDVSTPEAVHELPQVAAVHDETASAETPPEPVQHIEESVPEVDTPPATHRWSARFGMPCSEEDEVRLLSRQTSLLKEVVQEKRDYDVMVNKLNKRFSDISARKNKSQNEVVEIKYSIERILDELRLIESDPRRASAVGPVAAPGIRGPPLPSQDEIYMKAWGSGQVNGGTSNRQYSKRW